MMDKRQPTYDDANLALRLYEMRRETVMRKSRNDIALQFWPGSFEDVTAVLEWSHPINAAFRQVASYWEMVYGMAKNGIVHPEYLMESSGEGLMLYAKVFPFMDQLRRDFSPTVFQNAEWVVQNTTTGRAIFERFQARLEKLRQAAEKVG